MNYKKFEQVYVHKACSHGIVKHAMHAVNASIVRIGCNLQRISLQHHSF